MSNHASMHGLLRGTIKTMHVASSVFVVTIALGVFFVTPEAHAQSSCNLIPSGANIAQGFAAPYNVLTATQEMLVSVSCGTNQATLSVGSGAQTQYVYELGYTWRNNQWQQIELTGSNKTGGVWYVGSARGTLPQSGAELEQNNFVVAYVCQWTGTQWKCGCRDQACAQGMWQLQVFRGDAETTGTGTGTGTQTTGGTSGASGTTGGTTDGWWSSQMQYRVPIIVDPQGVERIEKGADIELDLTALLAQAGGNGSADPNSVRVVEVNSSGSVIDQAVPFQFVGGELTIIMEGETPANQSRTYHAYFNATGASVPANQSPSLVSVQDGIMDEHEQSIKVTTQNATYFMHKVGAGFSSMIDAEGNDWISYKGPARQTDGAGGWWRGVPAFLPIDVGQGGLFHPGFPSGSAELVSSGRVKATIRVSSSNAGGWEALWDIYPMYAKMRTLETGNGNFSILCECAPGGQTEVARDYTVRPDGQKIPASQEVRSDIAGENGIEWTYAGDDNLNRVLYMTHNDDNAADSSYVLQGNGGLYVFGFGRNKFQRTISGGPQEAVFAFAETTNHEEVRAHVHSAAQELSVSVGAPERR